jgi:predicted CXXCH cytochrome family protein
VRARRLLLGFAALLVLGLPIAGIAFSAAAVKKTSGPARSCYDCHAASRTEFKKKKFIHAPLLKDDCASCHRSHGFSQTLVLQKPADQLCLDCHAALVKAPAAAHQHPAFKRGDCLGCHDPHATDRPHLVRDETPASCFVCHNAAADEAKLAHVHEPFGKGDCVSCHEAHQGPNEALVRTKGDGLCTGCHALAQVDAKHAKTNRAGLECLDCHSPHASAKPSLLRGTSHAPVASGDCSSCHIVEGGKPTPKLVAQGAALCGECHDDKTDVAKRAHPHPPAAEGQCLECHDPHRGTSAGALLKARPSSCARAATRTWPPR